MNASAVETVLLVDDDKVTNMMHTRMLRQAALAKKIDVVTDGEAALAFLRHPQSGGQPPPQMILLDVNMPRMNGFEFLSEYKALPEELKAGQDIVMLSTSLLHQDRKQAEEDPDVRCFVAKPLRRDTLQALFEEYHVRHPG